MKPSDRFDFSTGPKPPTPDAAVERLIDPEALEVTLSKGLAERLAREGTMAQFRRELSAWAERKGTEGYTISAEPDEGPGTMIWRAKRA